MKSNSKTEHNKNFELVSEILSEKGKRYKESRERWDRCTKYLEVASSPLHIDIELTNICDIQCVMCERKLMKRAKGWMSLDLFRIIIDECAAIGVDSVKLNLWGESTLHKELIEMVRYAKENSALILQFNTNANRMTFDISKGLVEAGLDKITISVDGISKEVYEKVRIGGDFGRVMENIEGLLKAKSIMNSRLPHITLQILKMKSNKEEVKAFVEYWQEKVDSVSITNIGATTADRNILDLSVRNEANTSRKPCEQLWQRLSVLWDGTVTVCCNDYDGFLKIGHIKNDKLKDLWTGEKLTLLRKRHKAMDFEGTVCAKCIETVRYE